MKTMNWPVGRTPRGPRGWCRRRWLRIAGPASDCCPQGDSDSSGFGWKSIRGYIIKQHTFVYLLEIPGLITKGVSVLSYIFGFQWSAMRQHSATHNLHWQIVQVSKSMTQELHTHDTSTTCDQYPWHQRRQIVGFSGSTAINTICTWLARGATNTK